MNLSIRQIATFREVMRSGSISQAARSVGRTQPAVSAMIGTLEDALGFALFIREHGKLTPTPEAQFFLEECDAILARLDRTKDTLRRMKTLETGTLRIACHPAASSRFLPGLLTRFLADKPEVETAFIMRSSGVIEDLIASQQYDLALAETPQPRASIRQVDFDMDHVCILRQDDPLAARDELTPADLADRPLALLFDDHPATIATDAVFRACAIRYRRRFELRTYQSGLPFVEEGLCYMICDLITAYSQIHQRPESNLTIRRFRPRVHGSISILSPGYTTPTLLARSFHQSLTEALHQMQREMSEVVGG
ncbi:LysR family transcriptional regulator [Roseovarius nubinhibens]|jgi:DNA-binding transcriptional LysR family regulator|uniref:Transcriptional regulator, LysR family protein n=1 Tax=Roseovarius nubinhibens (strain ATCC BAA-591 / DSM 15170 / ISM) TaxID=89187 RepID=A3SHK4_ROSNI|nr:LysR substrate-binding domain-containing protein [Roseovarius nubinhibens]EAP76835.1 transcriptional regulator, LysR family protein [Roseovarius nubinhibens ISM]